jgi:hypothetical protein
MAIRSKTREKLVEWTVDDWEHFWDEVLDFYKKSSTTVHRELLSMKTNANAELDGIHLHKLLKSREKAE